MDDTSGIELIRLRALAEAITSGPWHRASGSFEYVINTHDDSVVFELVDVATADYLAAVDPPTILRLLAVVEAAQVLVTEHAAVLGWRITESFSARFEALEWALADLRIRDFPL